METKFCYYGDEILKKISEPITDFNSYLHQIAQELKQILKRKRGLGLAAPQIGILERICIISMEEMPEERRKLGKPVFLINPSIIKSIGSEYSEEGCLSFPGLSVNLERASHVEVEYQDLQGRTDILKVDGVVARAVQHEIDHLDGILLLDRVSPSARLRLGSQVKHMRRLIVELKEKGL